MGVLDEFILCIMKYEYSIIKFLPVVLILYLGAVYSVDRIHTVIHELGHGIFGLLAGCPILALRIGRYAVIKGDRGFKKFIHKKSGGQCILGSPQKRSFIKALFIVIGGSLCNLITSVIAFFFLIYYIDFIVLKFFLFLFSFYGCLMGFLNLIPRNKRVINDGRCLFLLFQDKESYLYYFTQLEITGYLYRGDFKSIPKSCFHLGANTDICNELAGYILLFQYYYHLDKGEIAYAKKCLKKFEPFEYRMGKGLLTDVLLEKLSLALILEKEEDIKKLWEHPWIQKRMSLHSKDLDIFRIKTLYEKQFNSMMDERILKKLLIDELFQGVRNLNKSLISEVGR